MAIVINGSGTVTGLTSITGTNATLAGITSVASNSADTPVVLQDSSSNTNTCRAWVNFNGTGTVAIRADFNVSSITDNGTGDYTVNFTTAMPDANYSAVGAAAETTAVGGVQRAFTLDTVAAGSTRVYTSAFTGTLADSEVVCVSIFR